MKDRTILGHIDCPTCGMTNAMRITPDKNGDPFGYCEANCGQQLRIGGDRRRVRDFFARYPTIERRADDAPAPAPEPKAPQQEAAPAEEQTPAPEKKTKAAPRSAMADALRMLGAM